MFCFKVNDIFIEYNPSVKVVIDEEEPDDMDIDGIRNLEDLRKLVLIDEEYGNLEVVVDGGERTRNINQKKKPDVSQAYKCQLCDPCYKGDCFFSKHVEYCESLS